MIQVIGAGFGRSGTTSLTKALEILDLGPCYHMQITMTRFWHARFWRRAKAGEPVDFRMFFTGYRSTVDWPSCEFYRELMQVYPDAKVLLNVRDPQEWYDSVFETLWQIQFAMPWWFPPSLLRMQDELIWRSRFDGAFTDRARTIAVYEAHLDEVRRTVPPERLLEYHVSQGWAPLCEFLGRPVPDDVPFPRLNDRRFFRRVLLALQVSRWMVPALVIGAVAWTVFACS